MFGWMSHHSSIRNLLYRLKVSLFVVSLATGAGAAAMAGEVGTSTLQSKTAPSEDKPIEDKPTEGKPGEAKPNEGKPGEDKPNEGKSIEDKNIERKTTAVPTKILDGRVEASQATMHTAIAEFKEYCKNPKIQAVVVLDMSDSIRPAVATGDLQKALDELYPVLNHLEGQEEIGCMAYATTFKKLPSITPSNYHRYITKLVEGATRKSLIAGLGWETNELSLMQSLLKEHRNATTKTLVVLFTDGATMSYDEVEKLLIRSAKEPIFWAFIGVGEHERTRKQSNAILSFASILTMPANSMWGGPLSGEHYALLKRFEKMSRQSGRNNAGFIEMRPGISADQIGTALAEKLTSWLMVDQAPDSKDHEAGNANEPTGIKE